MEILTLILQALYELTQWQYFWFLLIVWLIVDLAWFSRWQKLFARIGKLITKPVIFEKDDEPKDPPLYPRQFMESLAQRKQQSEDGPFDEFIRAQREKVFNSEHPLRSLGNVVTFAGLLFFGLADLIIIAQTMLLLNLMQPPLPDILQNLDYAILGGSFLSAIVGVWMLVDMSGRGELINTDQLNETQKYIYKIISGIVILFAVLVMLALTFKRMIALGALEASPTSELILSFIIYGLLAINNSLAAALTLSPGLSGFIVLLFVISVILVRIMPLLMFVLDVVWRFVYSVVDFVVWFLATPIIAFPYGILKLFGLL